MLFRYVGDEPDRLYPSLVLTVDDDGAPAMVAPFTVNNGDTIDLAADPGDGRWVAVTGKAAKTAKVALADNDPAREPPPVADVVPADPVETPVPTVVEPDPTPDEQAEAAAQVLADEQAERLDAEAAAALAHAAAAQTVPSDATKEQ